jgi:predicted small lipoprotein YifL
MAKRTVVLILAILAALAGCGEPEGPRFVPSKGAEAPGPSPDQPRSGQSPGNELNRRNIEMH